MYVYDTYRFEMIKFRPSVYCHVLVTSQKNVIHMEPNHIHPPWAVFMTGSMHLLVGSDKKPQRLFEHFFSVNSLLFENEVTKYS